MPALFYFIWFFLYVWQYYNTKWETIWGLADTYFYEIYHWDEIFKIVILQYKLCEFNFILLENTQTNTCTYSTSTNSTDILNLFSTSVVRYKIQSISTKKPPCFCGNVPFKPNLSWESPILSCFFWFLIYNPANLVWRF